MKQGLATFPAPVFPGQILILAPQCNNCQKYYTATASNIQKVVIIASTSIVSNTNTTTSQLCDDLLMLTGHLPCTDTPTSTVQA